MRRIFFFLGSLFFLRSFMRRVRRRHMEYYDWM